MQQPIQHKIVRLETYNGTNHGVSYSHVVNLQGTLALALMKHLAIVAADTDGEDTAGRQKMRLLPPEEVAQRACSIAASAYAQFSDRGWLIPVPFSESSPSVPTPPAPAA